MQYRSMYVHDPVSSRQIKPGNIVASKGHGGWVFFFCSHDCRQAVLASPNHFTSVAPTKTDCRQTT